MNSLQNDDAIDFLRVRLAAKPRYNWRRTLRNMVLIAAIWLAGVLSVVGAAILVGNQMKRLLGIG